MNFGNYGSLNWEPDPSLKKKIMDLDWEYCDPDLLWDLYH